MQIILRKIALLYDALNHAEKGISKALSKIVNGTKTYNNKRE
jgi:hypothetical protein